MLSAVTARMSAHADMSHKCDKKSSRTFQRNFSEEKFLSEGPQSDCNRREGPSLSVSLRDTEIHSSCAQLTHKEFRALRSASRGSAPTPRKPSRRLDPSFVPWVCIQILCQHNKSRAKSNSDHRNSYFAATAAPLGATIGIRISRQCSPQARPSECKLRGRRASKSYVNITWVV